MKTRTSLEHSHHESLAGGLTFSRWSVRLLNLFWVGWLCGLLGAQLLLASPPAGHAVGWGAQTMPYVESGTIFTNIAASGS